MNPLIYELVYPGKTHMAIINLHSEQKPESSLSFVGNVLDLCQSAVSLLDFLAQKSLFIDKINK